MYKFLPPRHTDNRHRQTRPTSSLWFNCCDPRLSSRLRLRARGAYFFTLPQRVTVHRAHQISLHYPLISRGVSGRRGAGGGARGPRRGARRRVFWTRGHMSTQSKQL